ncbi:amidohydrolase [Oleispirillum naphthae]|uniref:amidohydrolase n=1 Tax=Oleispirillum naphthae TaxID=2838853 RepID=UPI0030824A64
MSQESRVREVYDALHAMPEVGFTEVKTSAYLADALKKAGYAVQTGIGGTGVVGTLDSGKPGPVVGLRADMDALPFVIDGRKECRHACGHDAHSAMLLTAAEALAKAPPARGRLKIVFQPAEEILTGALAMIESGAVADVEMLFGIHLRPIQEARLGQATPALRHGASTVVETVIKGVPSHGARPHLGVNAIDAAAAVVGAVNAIRLNPAQAWSAKTTKLQAGGVATNLIPDRAEMIFDLRAETNALMDELMAKLRTAVSHAAAANGAEAEVSVRGGVPAAEYDPAMVDLSREAIRAVLGDAGVLGAIVTPGSEDFHFYVGKNPKLRPAYIGLGSDLEPGLHHPEMDFDKAALPKGVAILLEVAKRAFAA